MAIQPWAKIDQGQRLHRARVALFGDDSVSFVSRQTGLARQTIRQIENQNIGNRSSYILLRLFYGLSVDELEGKRAPKLRTREHA